jgi:hypothetical protein
MAGGRRLPDCLVADRAISVQWRILFRPDHLSGWMTVRREKKGVI